MSVRELVIQEAREKIIQKKNSKLVTKNLLKGALLGAGASGLITGANILADNPDVTHHPETAITGLLLGAGGGALLGMGLSNPQPTKPGNTKEEIKNRLTKYTLLGAGASALAMGGYAAAGNHIGHHRLIGAGLLLGAGAGHLLGRITTLKTKRRIKNKQYKRNNMNNGKDSGLSRVAIADRARGALRKMSNRKSLLERCGEKAFLKPDELKFPIVSVFSNSCEPNCKMLYAAYTRANQWGYSDIAARAAAMYKSNNCEKELGVEIHKK